MKILHCESAEIARPAGILACAERVIQARSERPVPVVAAMGSSHETLMKAGQRSAHQDVVLASTLAEGSRTYHMQVAQQVTSEVWPRTKKSLADLFDEITDLLKGLYLLGELTPRSERVLYFYAEGLAGTILAQVLEQRGCRSQCLFNRPLLLEQLDQQERSQAVAGIHPELQQEIDSLLEDDTVPVLPLSLAGPRPG